MPARPFRFIRRVAFEIVASVLAVTLVLAGGLAWRLGEGPVTLDVLAPYLAEALSVPERGLKVAVPHVQLVRQDQDIRLRIANARLEDMAGHSLAAWSYLDLRLNLAALLGGGGSLAALQIDNPSMTIIRRADGTWSLLATDAADPGQAQGQQESSGLGLRALLAAVPAVEVRLNAARVKIRDESRPDQAAWDMEIPSVSLSRQGQEVVADLWLRRPGQEGDIRASLRQGREGGDVRTEWTIRHVDLPAFLLNAPLPADLSPFVGVVTSPLSGQGQARLSADGEVMEVQAKLEAEAGRVDIPGETAGGETAGVASRGKVEFDHLALSLAVAHEGPAQMRMELRQGPARLSAQVDAGPAQQGIREWSGQAQVADVPMDDLGRLWPQGFGTNARDWIITNMHEGRLSEAQMQIQGRFTQTPSDGSEPVSVAGLSGTVAIEGVRVHYMEGLPDVTETKAFARFDMNGFDIDVLAGKIENLPLSPSSKLTIRGLSDPEQVMEVFARLSGPLAPVLDILDRPRLGYLSSLGLGPKAFSGQIEELALDFRFPLLRDLPASQLVYAAKAKLKNVQAQGVLPRLLAQADHLTLSLDRQGMELGGPVLLNGQPVAMTWQEKFLPEASSSDPVSAAAPAWQRRLTVKGSVGLAQVLEMVGGMPPGLRGGNGKMGLDLSYESLPSGEARVAAQGDLTQASLSVPLLAWSKEPGSPGALSLKITLPRQGGVSLDRLSLMAGLDSSEMKVEGALSIAKNGSLDFLRLDTVRHGRTDMTVALRRVGGQLDVTLAGRSLDTQGLFSGEGLDSLEAEVAVDQKTPPSAPSAAPASAPATPTPLRVQADMEQVWFESGALRDVRLEAARESGSWSAWQLTGKINDERSLSARFSTSAPGRRALDIRISDMGLLLRALGWSKGVVGGAVSATAEGPPDRLEGKISGTSYRLKGLPWLAQLVGAVSPIGLAELVGGEGIAFDRLDSRFVWQPREQIITLVEGRTAGASLGMSADGTIDIGQSRLDVRGTVVPVYFLNHILGSIPLLGTLLTGGEGQGLFAATYSMTGDLDAPKLQINPVSVLAPGFLRNLFFMGSDNAGKESPVFVRPEAAKPAPSAPPLR